MEYEEKSPVLKQDRERRRNKIRQKTEGEHEQSRQKAQQGGQPGPLGVTQGQNGEQGNTDQPEFSQDIDRRTTG